MFAINIANSKDQNIIYFRKNTLSLSIVCYKCRHEYEKIFKEEESIEILKFLV